MRTQLCWNSGRKPWVFLTVFFYCGIYGMSTIGLVTCVTQTAYAQSAMAQSQQPIAFDIAPGSLEEALNQFAETTGLFFSGHGDLIEGKTTLGLRGELTASEALDQLLRDSGLSFRFEDNRTITLLNAPQKSGPVTLSAITVTGDHETLPKPYAGGQVGSGARLGLLGNQNLFDTPFNITGYTEKLIRDQQVRSIQGILANDPSARSSAGEDGFITNDFFIRGFQTSARDIAFNGQYGLLNARRIALENVERVEILKGPSALLNGVSPNRSVGGTINLIPKRATDEPLTRLTTFFISQSQLGAHLDVGRRFGEDNAFGIRFNGVHREGGTPVDDRDSRDSFGSIGLDYRGERLRVSLDAGYLDSRVTWSSSPLAVAPGVEIPRAPDASVNLSQPFEFLDTEQRFVSAQAEFDLNDQVTLYAAGSEGRTPEFILVSTQSLQNAQGDYSNFFIFGERIFETTSMEVGLRANFDTGPVSHQFTVAASEMRRETKSVFAFEPGGSSNLYAPTLVSEPGFPGFTGVFGAPELDESIGISIADTLSFSNERVLLTLGARDQRIETGSYDESKVSPAVGLVVKPLSDLSLYGNYIEGLESGQTAPNTAVNAGEAFPPAVTRQQELGAKYDFGNMGVSIAAFQIERPSSFTDPATNRFSFGGEQINRGLELNIFGEPANGIRLLGGIAYTEGELAKTEGGTNDGKVAPGVPEWTLNLYGEYDLPAIPGLTVTARILHTSDQYYDQANTQSIPDWTRVDAGLRYVLKDRVTLRANVENAFDKNYWSSAADGFLSIGAPRTFLFSTQFDF